MICVSVMYPQAPGKRFDHAYYAETHRSLVLKLLGIARFEILKGLSGGMPGSEPAYSCIGNLYFNSVGDFQQGMLTHGAELQGDIPNFTDIAPQFQVSEVD